MATNMIESGDCLTLAAPADVASGAGVLVGSIFGVAASDALSGEPVVVNRKGVYELPKTSAQAWTAGAKIYWDNTGKVCTTTATSNTLVGAAAAAAANPSGTGMVLLDGAVR